MNGVRFAGLRYGALGLPLAFAALPLYVLVPSHYAALAGVPLAGLGAVLLFTRAFDALVDPWLGRWADHGLAGSRQRVLGWAGAAALLLSIGFCGLFFPPAAAPNTLLGWCAAALIVTSLGYSGLGVLHQSWGARLGGGPQQQAMLVGWREGLALAGVIAASVVPALAGISAMVALCVVGLLLGLLALASAPFEGDRASAASRASHSDAAGPAREPRRSPPAAPWRQPAFRWLLGVYVLNGTAAAVPATLVLFFIRDQLAAPAFEPLFLGLYFAAGALSMPLWVHAIRRHGLVSVWLAAMLLALMSFAWAAALGAGDVLGFALVCAASGAALGADLIAPPALLAGVIQSAGHAQRHEGAYFGWWTCASKLNLALAAGLALPALQWLGYRPGSRDAAALAALSACYALLPCALKTGAATMLWCARSRLEPCK